MKKLLSLGFCVALVSFIFSPSKQVYSQRSEANTRYEADHILVKLKADFADVEDLDQTAEGILQTSGTRVERLFANSRGTLGVISLDGKMSVAEAVRRARLDSRVEYAEPDYFVYATDTIPNDPLFNQMWGLSNVGCQFCDPDDPSAGIDAHRAWDITTGSDEVVAMVLDSGLDVGHEDLAANVWINPGEIPGNGIDDDANGFVDDINGWNFRENSNRVFISSTEDLHGTHVGGSIGAVSNNGKGVAGVAWNVKLIGVRFLGGSKGEGSTRNAIRGINYAINLRSRGVDVRVINGSWGGAGESISLRDAIAAAGQAGILFVCSAGNDSVDVDLEPTFPAAFSELDNVVSVAAMTQFDSLASFSNYGHIKISVAAPGQGIMSTFPRNASSPNGSYVQLSGTSMSAPYVSGIAALLWSNEPALTPAQVKHRIVSTSEPIPALASLSVNSGRANAYYALINRVAPPQSPSVARAEFTKKSVTIHGLGFLSGSSVIEANGAALPSVNYNASFAIANGTLTRLKAKIGKKAMKQFFPKGQPVSITVFNQTTGDRSSQFVTTRF